MENDEYLKIVDKILENRKFNKLKEETHHYNSDRFSHSLEVSYKTYRVCKKLRLDYKSATKAALLHDFFFNEDCDRKVKRLVKHPELALANAKKITNLSKKEENIIKSHMYPIGKTIPKSIESVVVNSVDNYVAVKEKFAGDFYFLKAGFNFLFILMISFIMR